MQPRYETDELARLIAARHELLLRLRESARRQLDLIGAGDMNNLLALLASKQSLLAHMQKVEQMLDSFRGQDPDSRIWRSGELREQTRQAAGRCEMLLREIILVEKQGEAELIRRRDETAVQLEGMHKTRRARTAYAETTSGAGAGLDMTSER